MRPLIIIGASGHGEVCADIAKLNGYEKIRFLDDDKTIRCCGEYGVVGGTADIAAYADSSDFFVAVGNSRIRLCMTEKIRECCGTNITLIHPAAVIAENVDIGKGTVIMAGAVINPGAKIGKSCIVNTCSSVDHDCLVNDYCHISVGAHLAGHVETGVHVWIGAGAVVSNNLKVAGNTVIGAGAVIVKDITTAGTYIGVPARKVK